MAPGLTRREIGAFVAVAVVIAVTLVWWGLAFWPAPAAGAEWLARARTVCFGIVDNGLPDTSGWIVLVLEPPVMMALLLVLLGPALRDGCRIAMRHASGRLTIGGVAVLVTVAAVLVGTRVGARLRSVPDLTAQAIPANAGVLARVDRPAPAFSLIDQRGDTLDLDAVRHRPFLVTFAFGHCETVCPTVVNDVRSARQRAGAAPPLLIFTLDPWRDTPGRLASMAGKWHLDGEEYVLSGPIDRVEDALDAWGISRTRDLQTGDIVHPRLVYLVTGGRIAFATQGGVARISELIRMADGT